MLAAVLKSMSKSVAFSVLGTLQGVKNQCLNMHIACSLKYLESRCKYTSNCQELRSHDEPSQAAPLHGLD